MIIDISSIRENKGATLKVEFQVDENTLGTPRDDIHYLGPIRASVEITNAVSQLFVSGVLQVTYSADCSRCLEPATASAHVRFSEAYVPKTKLSETDDVVDGSDETRTFEGDTIDLTDAVRDAVFTSAPIKLLCKTVCAGLCPVCGVNRNNGTCSCAEPVDPRLGVLARLLKNDESDDKH
jgi:uncharacterized protein